MLSKPSWTDSTQSLTGDIEIETEGRIWQCRGRDQYIESTNCDIKQSHTHMQGETIVAHTNQQHSNPGSYSLWNAGRHVIDFRPMLLRAEHNALLLQAGTCNKKAIVYCIKKERSRPPHRHSTIGTKASWAIIATIMQYAQSDV